MITLWEPLLPLDPEYALEEHSNSHTRARVQNPAILPATVHAKFSLSHAEKNVWSSDKVTGGWRKLHSEEFDTDCSSNVIR